MCADSAPTETSRTGPSTAPACRNAHGRAKLPAPMTAFSRCTEADHVPILLVPFAILPAGCALKILALHSCFLDEMRSAMPRLPPCKPAGRDAGARQSG